MSTSRRAIVRVAVRTWTRLYTRGLPSAARDRRLAEIESDLWESKQESAIGRLVRGIPADVGWRIEQIDGSHPMHARLQLLTTVCFVIGALLWALGSFMRTDLPPLPRTPVPIYVERHGPPPPPPPPPSWEDWVARFNSDAPRKPR